MSIAHCSSSAAYARAARIIVISGFLFGTVFGCGSSDDHAITQRPEEGDTARDRTGTLPVSASNDADIKCMPPRPSMADPGMLVAPVMGRAADSLRAVRIGACVLGFGTADTSFRVQLFVAVEDGFLVRLQSYPPYPGGGGLLWVEPDGTVRVLRRAR